MYLVDAGSGDFLLLLRTKGATFSSKNIGVLETLQCDPLAKSVRSKGSAGEKNL